MTTKGTAIRVWTYIFEVIFFVVGIVFFFLSEYSMSLASLAMSEICRLHRVLQKICGIIAKIIEKISD